MNPRSNLAKQNITFKYKKYNYELIFDKYGYLHSILCIDCGRRELKSTKKYIEINNRFFAEKAKEFEIKK